jgi:hypothetical protein
LVEGFPDPFDQVERVVADRRLGQVDAGGFPVDADGRPRGSTFRDRRIDRRRRSTLRPVLRGCPRPVGTTTTYVPAAAVIRLDEAQRLLDAHVMVLGTGGCRLCGTLASYDQRDAASATFVRYRRLPQRRPAASRRELTGARRFC